MKKMLQRFILLAGFALIYSSAQASTGLISSDVGSYTLTPGVSTGDTFVHAFMGVSFADSIDFSLDTPGIVTGNALNVSVPGVLDIDSGFMWKLFEGTSTAPVAVTNKSGSFGLFDLGALGAGDYFLNFSGTTTGSAGGAYTVSLGVQPVPLPLAGWLFGSAVLGFLGIGARRKA